MRDPILDRPLYDEEETVFIPYAPAQARYAALQQRLRREITAHRNNRHALLHMLTMRIEGRVQAGATVNEAQQFERLGLKVPRPSTGDDEQIRALHGARCLLEQLNQTHTLTYRLILRAIGEV